MIDLLTIYPNAKDCVDGHIGEPVETLHSEINDDRYDYIVTAHCDHCGIPISGDRYASDDDIARLS